MLTRCRVDHTRRRLSILQHGQDDDGDGDGDGNGDGNGDGDGDGDGNGDGNGDGDGDGDGHNEDDMKIMMVMVKLAVAVSNESTFVATFCTLRCSPCEKHFLSTTHSIKIIRIYILSEHNIVIQVQKFAADSWNAVQMGLDGRRRECR
jgi:hypothetical protein